MKLDASLETRTSKDGNTYQCVVIKISEKSEKLVFLSPAEIELIELNNRNKVSNPFDNMPDLK